MLFLRRRNNDWILQIEHLRRILAGNYRFFSRDTFTVTRTNSIAAPKYEEFLTSTMSPLMMLGKKKSLGMNLRLVIGRMRDIMRTLNLRQKRLAQIDNSDLIMAFVPKERALGR